MTSNQGSGGSDSGTPGQQGDERDVKRGGGYGGAQSSEGEGRSTDDLAGEIQGASYGRSTAPHVQATDDKDARRPSKNGATDENGAPAEGADS